MASKVARIQSALSQQHSRSDRLPKIVKRKSAMKSSSKQSNTQTRDSIDASSDATALKSAATQKRLKAKVTKDRKRGKPTYHGGIFENRWSQPDLTETACKSTLTRYASSQDLLVSSETVLPTAPMPKLSSSTNAISVSTKTASKYSETKPAEMKSRITSPGSLNTVHQLNKRGMQYDCIRSPVKLNTVDATAISPTRIPASMARTRIASLNKSPKNYSGHKICQRLCGNEYVNVESDCNVLLTNNEHDTVQRTELERMKETVSDLEQSNRKLVKQNAATARKLQQASELVRNLLGKVKEAEKKTRQVSSLEMEVLSLKRKLTQSGSRDHLISISSNLSDDALWKTDLDDDSVFEREEERRSPEGWSEATAISESCCNKENVNVSQVLSHSTIKRKRGASSNSNPESSDWRNTAAVISNNSTSSCRKYFDNLLKEHNKALKLIKALEKKFTTQQKVIRTLKRDIASVKEKTRTKSFEEQQQQMSTFIQSLCSDNMSNEDIGQYLVDTFRKTSIYSSQESGVSSSGLDSSVEPRTRSNTFARRSLVMS